MTTLPNELTLNRIYLALPDPMPEEMIASNPQYYYECQYLSPRVHHYSSAPVTLNKWTGDRFRGKLNPEAMKSWIEPYVQDRSRIIGSLEDYRAGATLDLGKSLPSG